MLGSRLLRTAIAAAVTAATLLSPALSPSASAAVGTAVLEAQGTYSPGIPATGCAEQTLTWDGTMALAGEDTGVYNVHFDGNSSICESAAEGEGDGTLSGDGVTGSVHYRRVGTAVTYSGTVVVNGRTYTILGWVCIIIWLGPPPFGPWIMICFWVPFPL